MSALLATKNLSCERDERKLFENLSFELFEGQVAQIAGPNGAGKTTLLKILTGLSNLFEGEIFWRGAIRKNYDFYSSLLYLGHLPGVKSSLTAIENLEWYFGLNGLKCATRLVVPSRETLKAALAEVGLNGYGDIPCHQMSAGQQRRVGLARLYCTQAPLWILDEPFTAIDKKGVAALEARIDSHAKSGGLVVLTTHQPLKIENVQIIDLENYMPSRTSSRHD